MSTQNVNVKPSTKESTTLRTDGLCATFIPETRSMLSAPM